MSTTTKKQRRVQSAEEAHDLHETWRAWLLALARHHAVSYALLHTTVHTRNVRDALCDEGILPAAGVGAGAAVERWLGSVFKKGPWVWTGTTHAVTSSATNIHGGQSVKVWRLNTRDTDELAPWLVRPEEPEGARDRVLALYAPPVRTSPDKARGVPDGASVTVTTNVPTNVPTAPRAPVLAWPADLDAGRVADELGFFLRQAVLAGERPPVGFEELERLLRGLDAEAANSQG